MDSHQIVSALHLLILGPLLLAIGLGYVSAPITLGLGVLIILYHLYKFVIVRTSWVNLFHVLVVGPALLSAGLLSSRWPRELVLMLGFAAVGYHGYYLLMPIV